MFNQFNSDYDRLRSLVRHCRSRSELLELYSEEYQQAHENRWLNSLFLHADQQHQ